MIGICCRDQVVLVLTTAGIPTAVVIIMFIWLPHHAESSCSNCGQIMSSVYVLKVKVKFYAFVLMACRSSSSCGCGKHFLFALAVS